MLKIPPVLSIENLRYSSMWYAANGNTILRV